MSQLQGVLAPALATSYKGGNVRVFQHNVHICAVKMYEEVLLRAPAPAQGRAGKWLSHSNAAITLAAIDRVLDSRTAST